jgi:cell fate (sporulation/competence/biofilm development) regulator YlbF (YheA/YmcA/DUF963 family)
MKREYSIDKLDYVIELIEKLNKDAIITDGMKKVYNYAKKYDKDTEEEYIRVFYVYRKVQPYEASRYDIDDFDKAKADIEKLNSVEKIDEHGFKRYHILKQKVDNTGKPFIYKCCENRKVIPTDYEYSSDYVENIHKELALKKTPFDISKSLKIPLLDVLRILNNEKYN